MPLNKNDKIVLYRLKDKQTVKTLTYNKTGLTPKQVDNSLKKLIDMGLVKKTGGVIKQKYEECYILSLDGMLEREELKQKIPKKLKHSHPDIIVDMKNDKNKVSLNETVVRNINKDIANYFKQRSRGYFFSIDEQLPFDVFFRMMKKYGVIGVQEDGTKYSGMLIGKSGRARINLALKNFYNNEYRLIRNAVFVYNWMDLGNRKEVNVYVS